METKLTCMFSANEHLFVPQEGQRMKKTTCLYPTLTQGRTDGKGNNYPRIHAYYYWQSLFSQQP